jgi:hypothetical protein
MLHAQAWTSSTGYDTLQVKSAKKSAGRQLATIENIVDRHSSVQHQNKCMQIL